MTWKMPLLTQQGTGNAGSAQDKLRQYRSGNREQGRRSGESQPRTGAGATGAGGAKFTGLEVDSV